jgi:hypothetical protein
VSITAKRSILTNAVSHLIDILFTTNLRAKYTHSSNHVVNNRKRMFYVAHTKHDCIRVQCICDCSTNSWPSFLPSANHCQGQLQNSKPVKIFMFRVEYDLAQWLEHFGWNLSTFSCFVGKFFRCKAFTNKNRQQLLRDSVRITHLIKCYLLFLQQCTEGACTCVRGYGSKQVCCDK